MAAARTTRILLFATIGLVTLTACGTDFPPTETNPPPPPPGVTACAPVQSTGWIWTDVAPGTKPVVALSGAGVPYVAYMEEDFDGWVRLAPISSLDGAAGQSETVADGYFYGPFDMTIAGGEIFIAYHDHDLEDLVLARRAVDGTWASFRQTNTGHDGWHASVYRDAVGGVHVASLDPAGFNGQGLFYASFASDVFSLELAIPGTYTYDGGLSLDVAPDGTVYAVVFDELNGVAWMARRNSPDNWTVEMVEPSGTWLEVGRFPQLKVGADGTTLHLVYLARDGQSTGSIRYATGTFGALSSVEVSPISDIEINRGLGARNLVDLAFLADETPVVAFQSRSETFVAWGTTSGFDVRERLAAPAGTRLRQQVSLSVHDDQVHLAFWQGDLPGLVCYGRK